MNDELIEIARLGVDAEAFLQSPLGKYLYGQAKAEIESATQELIDADPEDGKLNRELRSRIHVARMFTVLLDSVVSCGRQAYDQLKEEEGK